jgi:diguanylate cyclase
VKSGRASTAIVLAGIAFGFLAFVVPAVSSALYLASVVLLIGSAVFAFVRRSVDRRLMATVVAVGVVFTANIISVLVDAAPLWTEVLDFVGGALLGVGLLQIVRIGRAAGPSAIAEGIVGDGIIVGLGAWLVTWITLVQRMLEDRKNTGTSVLSGLYLPLGCALLFLVAIAMFRSPIRHRSLSLVCLAVLLSLVGDALDALALAGVLGEFAQDLSYGAYIVAYSSAAAAFVHPSLASLGTMWDQARRKRLSGRILTTAAAMTAPTLLLATVQPASTSDRVVRLVSALALSAAVTWRVVTAVRANNASQSVMMRSAQTDSLTGLPNRALIVDDINEQLHNAWRTKRVPTVYFIDLDRFKNINDSLGHAAGDELLRLVSRRLVHAAPELASVGRLSGDEYVVIDSAAESPGRALSTAERLLNAFREPFNLSHGDVFITASIGVASATPTTTTNADDLLRHADTAMYRAKDAGRNCMAIYDESMHERVAQRLSLETKLYRALDRRELKLFHQPILDLETSDVVGFEALMRWQQADGTLVSPAEFIPIAEDTGTILSLGAWAMLEALTQLRTWIDEGVCSSTASMSVNVAPRQLADGNFPGIVSEALTRSGVSAHQLWLEVTEGTMISEPEVALATLRKLRSLGVRIALDDFGTGYSSLSLLQRFPLQRLKIDRAFVSGVAENSNDRSLVRTIVAMGRALGLDLVAEGVESIRQLQVLHDLGCTKAQGYLISHPVPADAMRSTVTALERLGSFPGLRPSSSTDPIIR